jgi:hypothetical protein
MFDREQIIEMASEAGFHVVGGFVTPGYGGHITSSIERFAALVAASEREECAKVCENKIPTLDQWSDPEEFVKKRVVGECAEEIRARGELK